MLTCHRPALYLTRFAVGSIEYSLCKFIQRTYFLLTIHKYTRLPSSDTVSDRVCRWLVRVCSVQPWALSLLPSNNPKIYWLAIAPTLSLTWFVVFSIAYCLSTFRQSSYFRLIVHKYIHLPSPDTVSDRVYRWVEDSFRNFRQLAYFQLTINKYTHLPSPNTASERACRWLDGLFSSPLADRLLPISNSQLYSNAISRHCF